MKASNSEINEDKLRQDLSFVKDKLDKKDTALMKHIKERDEHRRYLRTKNSKTIMSLSLEDFEDFFNDNVMWSAERSNVIKNMVRVNGFEKTKMHFANVYQFIEEGGEIDNNTWKTLTNLKYFGRGWLTEILAALNNNYILYNQPTCLVLKRYTTYVPTNDSGKNYNYLCSVFEKVCTVMKDMGFEECEPYDADGVLKFLEETTNPDLTPKNKPKKNSAGQKTPTDNPPSEDKTRFTKDDVLKDSYLTENELDQILSLLERKKNIILAGPPGVGKTYLARRIAYVVIGDKKDGQIELVQFHQSYSYEQFICGYKPNEKGFAPEDGVFKIFCDNAAKKENQKKKFVFIIDEINRGNLSKIFGEALALVENDKRIGSKDQLEVKLAYGNKTFGIPGNVYLIGTMNTADRSLAIMDYALRRRFAFKELEPRYDESFENSLINKYKIKPEIASTIRKGMSKINEEIEQQLGTGYCIGHSFFIPDSEIVENQEQWFDSVVEFEIEPLLQEYYYGEKKTAETLLSNLKLSNND